MAKGWGRILDIRSLRRPGSRSIYRNPQVLAIRPSRHQQRLSYQEYTNSPQTSRQVPPQPPTQNQGASQALQIYNSVSASSQVCPWGLRLGTFQDRYCHRFNPQTCAQPPIRDGTDDSSLSEEPQGFADAPQEYWNTRQSLLRMELHAPRKRLGQI